jgi:HSP20 family protein|tara:strand:+ start:115 stop:540 length:426 start_codon:yes stop_codon:yes gene_type:complete
MRDIFDSSLPMRSIFDSFLNHGFVSPWSGGDGGHLAVDVRESGDEYILSASVPGVAAKDLSIEIEDDGMVSISSHVSAERASEENGYLVRERRMNGCRRRLRLATALDAGEAKAVVENGVLTLTLPKAAEAKPRRISIEVK